MSLIIKPFAALFRQYIQIHKSRFGCQLWWEENLGEDNLSGGADINGAGDLKNHSKNHLHEKIKSKIHTINRKAKIQLSCTFNIITILFCTSWISCTTWLRLNVTMKNFLLQRNNVDNSFKTLSCIAQNFLYNLIKAFCDYLKLPAPAEWLGKWTVYIFLYLQNF